MMSVNSACKEGNKMMGIDNGKYVRYTPEQVDALERFYHECPKPTSMRRQQLIRECPILSNIDPKQIKVWFQNRRCREKQRKESSRLQAVNRKLTAMNKLLMEENDRLQKQVSHLVYDNSYFRQQTQNVNLATKDISCESVVTSGQNQLASHHPPRDASPAGLLSIAEETLAEFLSKATGTAVEWVQLPGMKPGPDSIGIIAISHGCTGVAARACSLVGLEPTRVSEILKDRASWYRDCRAVDVLNVLSTGNGGIIELLYMQLYAPTTLAPARDFWLLRYTSVMEDGSLVVCERSLNNTQNGPSMPPVQNFVRAEILSSGYLIRPCEGGGSIIHIVDHMELEPQSVPEVLRPLYQSSTLLAQRTTIAALRHLRQISQEVSQPNATGWGRRPAALRALSQKLSKGFNDAVNGFTDEGWSMLESDGIDDVTLLVNSSRSKLMSINPTYANGFSSMNNAVLCAKASMLLQNVPPAILLRFLREHRSEWADSSIDAYSAASIKAGPCSLPVSRAGSFGGQVILPLAQTIEHEEFLEVIKLENMGHYQDDMIMPVDIFLLQLRSGVDENVVGTSAELIFAPIDASFSDDAPILPSGFRIIPLDSGKDAPSSNRTLDLASALEVGSMGSKSFGDNAENGGCRKSVMTIAFQFAFEIHLQDSVSAMARQYVRSIVASVQRVALALSPSPFGSQASLHPAPGTPEAQTLACWICQSYRCYLGVELLKSEGSESILKSLWNHSDAVLCCSLKALPFFTFANQAGLDMLETTLVALQDITLEKIFDDNGRKILCSEFPHIMQQGYMCLQGGICMSSMGRPISYERAVAWKVLNEEENDHCLCFMFINWSFALIKKDEVVPLSSLAWSCGMLQSYKISSMAGGQFLPNPPPSMAAPPEEMEQLTSGASSRIIPILKVLRASLIFLHTFLLSIWLLILPRRRRRGSAPLLEQTPPTSLSKKRRSSWRKEEDDTMRRRTLAEGLDMGFGDTDIGESQFRWSTSLFFGVRRNALFCRSWFPVSGELKCILVIIHGLNEHSGRYIHFAKQLTSCNFGVYAMDWIGHGGSDGLHGYVPSLDHVVSDTGAFLDKIKSENPGVPRFLFGHSTGGAVVLKAASYSHIESMLEGIVLTAPALRVKPAHPFVGAVAPIFSLIAPKFQFKGANKRGIPVSRDPAALLTKYSDPLVYTGPMRVRTGHEILRMSSYLLRNFKSVTVPFFVLHGTADRVTDPLASQNLYDEAASKFKSIRLYEGFLHDLLFEPEREEIGQDIINWMEKRLKTAQKM